MPKNLGDEFVNIIGSPRSGTTILAQTLNAHPDIAYFYEPYYVWDYLHGSGVDDSRGPEYCRDETLDFIQREMKTFLELSNARIVVEQSPEESLKLPLIKAALPNARFIHLVRDGYDCIASIKREWDKRKQLVSSKNPVKVAGKVRATLLRQPYWHFRIMQIKFELKESGIFKPWRWTNKSKWQGEPGWGVRIPGWQDILANEGELALNAHQWVEAVRCVRRELSRDTSTRWKEVRYEELITNPQKELALIAQWMNIDQQDFNVNSINANSLGRGRNSLNDQEIACINPIIEPVMKELGYPLM